MEKHVDANYNQITDHIWLGTNFCCQEHFDEGLKKLGIEVDISLEKERIDAPYGLDYFVWLPIEDTFPPKPDQLQFGIDAMKKFTAMDKKMYVHCLNGHGRSTTLVAAYLIAEQNMSVDEAQMFIKERRPEIHLNEKQITALEEFKETLS